MQKKRKEIIDQLQKKGIKGKVPRHVLAAFSHIIKTECNEEVTYVKRSHDQDIKEVIRQQQKIGIHLMLWGFLVKGWMTTIEKVGASYPERRMNTL